ncbi:deoxyribodipyrimidine photo-lyase-like [Bactrocera tryoni]|uniref:deoxyribodipyrimidine photo-lyase-like n=1 Tax=Bactrocera tryoni TaxID=59916 RepID=UPI001A966F75|nr:deoxyribodipyrimidine photo-lyase-like [Bactrocera tryoni]
MKRVKSATNAVAKPKKIKSAGSSGVDTNNDSFSRVGINEKAASTTISVQSLQQRRLATAESIAEFSFNKKRVRVLNSVEEVSESRSGGILYWMSREARVQDNWAFLYSQRLALKLKLPLLVTFCLVPKYLNATLRQYKFLIGGLKEVERDCRELSVPLHLCFGSPKDRLPELVNKYKISALVCDFTPLRVPQQWVEEVKEKLSIEVPFIQADAHNVVPLWIASDKQEYGARTIRGKINSKLPEFLTEFPPVIKHPHNKNIISNYEPVNWQEAEGALECDRSVDEVDWAQPGYTAACAQLQSFCAKRLRIFNEKRNDPTINALSGLSPWFHYGHISVQRCVLEVMRLKSKYKASVEAFCEEAIVRRELADNFCYYNEHYDSLKGLHAWAAKTLEDHRKDKRSPSYTLAEFEQARTHNDLWNAAQLQLLREGKMHGFMRMYWAKKILEWSSTPDAALETAIFLNDKYSLDGLDPNGYVGCMWSIGGVHDQGWAERPIFGKIRYMNYKGCQRKFDVAAFVARYGSKAHNSK